MSETTHQNSTTQGAAMPEYLNYTYDMFLSSVEGEESEINRFYAWGDAIEKDGRYAFEAARLQGQQPKVTVRRTTGEIMDIVNLSSYNYLGFSQHPRVIAAAKAALDQFGLGACSSPVQAGTLDIHKLLEKRLIDFIGLPNRGVTLFSSGYCVNTGTISALMKRGQHIIADSSSHMSIMEGAQLSRAKIHLFEHNNPTDLRRVLEEVTPGASRVMVCTEGVFSADGDFGRLREIVPLAKSFGAQVLLDEAHSFLVAGPNGRGVAEEQGVLDQIDYLVVTFSKALGAVGGALISSREVARYVNWYARCRMFSCALDPAVAGGVAEGLLLAATEEGAARRKRARENAAYLRSQLQGRVPLGRTESWIVPVIYGPERNTLPLSDFLQREGLDGSVMEFPAVPIGEARIRLFITSEHEKSHLDKTVEVILRAAEKFHFALDRQVK